jgi:hypothetical protein
MQHKKKESVHYCKGQSRASAKLRAIAMSCDVVVDQALRKRTNTCQTMPTSRRKKRARTHVAISYDDDLREDDDRDITVVRSTGGRFIHSSTVVREPEARATDSTNPWTNGFFDKNSEAFVVDSLPDELQGFDMPDSQLDFNEEVKDRPKVLTVVCRLLLVY